MCPACISTATLMIAGSISTGGLATLVRLKFRAPTGPSIHEPTGRELTPHEPTHHQSTNHQSMRHEPMHQNGEEQI